MPKDDRNLKILFVASEAAPFVKVGGLGEVMRSLPKALRELGHDARVFVPKYASMDLEKFKLESELNDLKVNSPNDTHGILVSNVLKNVSDDGAVAYFLENMEYFEKRANVYGYADDTVRWVYLSRAVLEFLRVSEWKPDVVVASDWQTGFISNLIHTEYKDDPVISGITVAFSIHNLKFQGLFDPRFVSEMDFDSGQKPVPDMFETEEITKLSGMRRGIMFADVINTVSPTYAKEILSEEFGEGLDKLLNERKSRLFGILNGIDIESLDPETDPDLTAKYSAKNLDKRKENKIALQKQFGLPVDENKFVAGIVSRMDSQKGFDLLTQIMDPLMANIDFQLIIVGEGDMNYRAYFEELKVKFPDKVAGHFTFDSRLPRMIFGGADVMLIPSRFEPSGLVQMESMRYGCVPIVRKVGGLADSVDDFDPAEEKGTGFVFEKFDPFSLTIAFVRAHELYKQKKEWNKLVQRAMTSDFSWKKSAQEYLKLFEMAIRFHNEKAE